MAVHRRPGDIPRSSVVDVEQPGVREDEPPGCSLPLNLVDELLGGTVRVGWRKIAWLLRLRTGARRFGKNWEWIQWLAEQIDRHSEARARLVVGAHEAYRDWRA
jgi:hypothetical protein